MNVLLAGVAALLFGIGSYLLMQRKLSRIIIGLGLLSHASNVLLMNAGRDGSAPIIGGDPATFADPLPQALALTAIVISFGMTGLLLAFAYRSWLLTSDDEVVDDVEDRMVATEGAFDKEVPATGDDVDPVAPADPDDDASRAPGVDPG